MPPTFEEFLRKALDEYDKARSESDLQLRLDKLEARFGEDLSDEQIDRIVARLEARYEAEHDDDGDDDAGVEDEAGGDDGHDDDGDEHGDGDGDDEHVDRPRGRRRDLKVPKIWQGDDEPDLVEYVDVDTGKVAVREGRKKGAPAVYDFDEETEEAA